MVKRLKLNRFNRMGVSIVAVSLLFIASCASEKRKPEDVQAIMAQGGLFSGKKIASSEAETPVKQTQSAALPAEEKQQPDKRPNKINDQLSKVTQIEETSKGTRIRLEELFDFGSDQVKPKYEKQIVEIGKVLSKHPDQQVIIEGHTDSIGSHEINNRLSVSRADSVRSILEKQGVGPDQLQTIGLGKKDPIATNDTEDGRAKNRRAELRLESPSA